MTPHIKRNPLTMDKDHFEPKIHIFEAKSIISNHRVIYIRSEIDHFEPTNHIFEAKPITSNPKIIYSKRKRSLRPPKSHIFEAKTITSNQQIIYSKRKRSLRPKKSYIRSENDHFEPKSHIFEAKAITSNPKVLVLWFPFTFLSNLNGIRRGGQNIYKILKWIVRLCFDNPRLLLSHE